MLKWRSMAHTVRCFWLKNYLSAMREICGEFFIFQQGNVPAHRTRETINLLKRDTCVHFVRPFATEQHKSEPGWLQNIGRNIAASLASSWRRLTEATLDRCLSSFRARRHRWCSWWVAHMSLSVDLYDRRTFWASNLTPNNANNNNVVLHILLVNFVNIKELLEVLNAAEFRHFWSFIFYKVVQRHI